MTAHLDDGAPAWCQRLLSELDAADQRAIAVAKSLTTAQLNWAPARGVWSVGQCLDHLCVTNAVYLPAIARSFAGERTGRVHDISRGWVGEWFIRRFIEPSPGTARARAPKKITPGTHVEPSIVDRLVASNGHVRDLVRRAGQYDVNRIRFANPFLPLLRFRVGTGLEIVAAHQRRHLLQAERIRQLPEFPDR